MNYYGFLIYSQLPHKEFLKFSLIKNPHFQISLSLFEPRLSAKSEKTFKEIKHAEKILKSVNNLVASIRFVIAALELSDNKGTQQPARKDFVRRMQELKKLCSKRDNNAKNALNAFNRQLNYFTKKHAIRETKAIKILTILASLYLPLSLSASMLSILSPFKAVAHTKTSIDQDLIETNMLFNFFGVFIELATITIFILYAIRLGLKLKSKGIGMISKKFSEPFSIFHYGRRWRFGGRGGQIFELIRVLTALWIGVGLCITLLMIFLIDMLKSVQQAWDTARWMFATYFVIVGALLACYADIYGSLYHKRLRSK